MFLLTKDFIIYYNILLIINNIQYSKYEKNIEHNRICYIKGKFPSNVKHIVEGIKYVVHRFTIFDLRRTTNYTVVTQESELAQKLHVGMILTKLQEFEKIILQNCQNVECTDFRLNGVHVNSLNFINEYVAGLARLVNANLSYALSQHKIEFDYLKGLASKISENADSCAKNNLRTVNILKENLISKNTTVEGNSDSNSVNKSSKSRDEPISIVDLNCEIVEKEYTIENYNCSFEECSVGNYIADGFVTYLTMRRREERKSGEWTTAALALVCSATIHGNITVKHAYTNLLKVIRQAVPKSQELIIIKLRGDNLYALLMDGIRPLRHEAGRPIGTESFLQVSGIKMSCNVDERRGVVSDVLLRCQDCMEPKYERLNYARYYPVILQQSVAEGLYGHRDTYHNNGGIYKSDRTDVEALVWYCNLYKHIIPGRQRRIEIRYDKDYPGASSIYFLESMLLVNIFVLLFCK